MDKEIKDRFSDVFKSTPLMVIAPGRINLIGEHTDYNLGFVLPAAIDKHIVFAVASNGLSTHRFVSRDLNEEIDIPVDDIAEVDKHWANYLVGVLAQLKKAGIVIGGVDCVFGGDIPLGAGLSSSAALETGFAFALNELFHLKLSKLELVKLSQIAEHEYAGVNCGIMDQFISVFGEKDKVLRLDCRSLEYQYFPLKLDNYSIILCDTQVKHSLASSEYNNRRMECEAGVKILQKFNPETESLRDVTPEFLYEYKGEFPKKVYNRCKFVVEEIQRLNDACEALSKGQLVKLGDLMYKTHAGLRDEYEVSCKELDILVEIAKESGVVIGSRMMGGGFGGCTINIVHKTDEVKFIEMANEHYKKSTGIVLKTYKVSIEQGTHILN